MNRVKTIEDAIEYIERTMRLRRATISSFTVIRKIFRMECRMQSIMRKLGSL